MSGERLDKHSKIHHELFDEDTNTVGSLGDIVEKHAGDAVFLTPEEKSVGGADGGLSDWEAEMTETDPAPNAGMDAGDLYSEDDGQGLPAADQTGTVAGIARGFGTHLPQDLGRGGFQVEEVPDTVLGLPPRIIRDGEELDDYDDDNNDDADADLDEDSDEEGDDLDATLARASEPGANAVSGRRGEPTPGRIPVKERHASSTDDELDTTREIK